MGIRALTFNPLAFTAYNQSRLAGNALTSNMEHLSSGQRLQRPGDGPVQYSLAERFSFQIRNSSEALRNIQLTQNLVTTTDSWLEQVQSILDRMGNLATSSIDGSKNVAERQMLQEEYSQLKNEIARISQVAEFNQINIAGNSQVLAYDAVAKNFKFSKLNGTQSYDLPNRFLAGTVSSNGLDYLFDPNNDYITSNDGKYIFYSDSNDDLVRYDIETNTITRDSSDSAVDKKLEIGDDGQLWYARNTGGTVYEIKRQDINTWTEDISFAQVVNINDVKNGDFSVYDNRIHYMNTQNNLASVSVFNENDVSIDKAQAVNTELTLAIGDGVTTVFSGTINGVANQAQNIALNPIIAGTFSLATGIDTLTDDSSGNIINGALATVGTIDYNTGTYTFTIPAPALAQKLDLDYDYRLYNTGAYSISEDGRYLADVPAAISPNTRSNTVRITDVVSGKQSMVVLEGDANISKVGFDGDATHIFFTDLSNNAIRSVRISESSSGVSLGDLQLVQAGQSGAIDDEILAAGDGTTVAFTGTLSQQVIVPGSVTITDGVESMVDDGLGNLIGGAVNGTINYTTGAYTVTFTAAPASGVNITADYTRLSYANFNASGGSNHSRIILHDGPNANDFSVINLADVRLITLGIARDSILLVEDAKNALGNTTEAIDRVSAQRARLGGEYSRLLAEYDSLTSYQDNITQAESILKDVNVPQESAEMASNLLWYNTTLNLIARANTIPQALVELLRNS